MNFIKYKLNYNIIIIKERKRNKFIKLNYFIIILFKIVNKFFIKFINKFI